MRSERALLVAALAASVALWAASRTKAGGQMLAAALDPRRAISSEPGRWRPMAWGPGDALILSGCYVTN